ncbi:MAG: thioredoxin reductase [Clostridia bacterium]|nr:thioredoxin reductase [Clostridia bacterium]
MYDAIIIGKGPSGLSAALYLGRDGYKVLVLGKESILEKCKELNNYIGIESISGSEFIKRSIDQVIDAGAEIKNEKVLKILKNDEVFYVKTNISEYSSKTIVLALGIKKSDVKIKNIDKFIGKGVSYCASCDGYFYKNKNIGVIGNSEYAVEEALNLKNYTDNVTIYTNGMEMNISEKYISSLKKFDIDNRKIQSIFGDEFLSHVIFGEDEKLGIDGIFIANDTPNIDDLSNGLGIITENNRIKVDENNITNIDGVFACGDIINNFKQVSTAVGSGAVAGHSCVKYLIMLKLSKEKKYEH